MKIYLSGVIIGSYRAQNIIKTIGDAGIPYFYSPIYFPTPSTPNRPTKLVLTVLMAAMTAFLRPILIGLSTHVLVLPMNTSVLTIIEVFIGRLLKKK